MGHALDIILARLHAERREIHAALETFDREVAAGRYPPDIDEGRLAIRLATLDHALDHVMPRLARGELDAASAARALAIDLPN